VVPTFVGMTMRVMSRTSLMLTVHCPQFRKDKPDGAVEAHDHRSQERFWEIVDDKLGRPETGTRPVCVEVSYARGGQ
jgi:hypothetical protein